MSRINGDISEKLETTPERIFEKVGSSAKSLWRHLVYIAILDLERKRVDQLIIFAIFISFVFCFGEFTCYRYFHLVVIVESFQS